MSEWLTNTDIAKLSGLKVRTIYKYRERNTLPEPDHQIGKVPLWKKETVDNWLKTREMEITND